MAVMDLAGLPNGTRVFVDTNIFFLHFLGRSATCTTLIQRIQVGEVPAYVNSRVATPRNKSAWDVYHQIKLFHQDDRTDLPVDPPTPHGSRVTSVIPREKKPPALVQSASRGILSPS